MTLEQSPVDTLIAVGHALAAKGWAPATSGNISMRLNAQECLVTVSGSDLGALSKECFVKMDIKGHALEPKQPSAEALLHTMLYRLDDQVGAVLHTHSMHAVLLSQLESCALHLTGYELLKAFKGIESHNASIEVPIFENDQAIPRLASCVEDKIKSGFLGYGYLIAGHGLYVWAQSVPIAFRYLEAFEYLFECELRLRGMRQ